MSSYYDRKKKKGMKFRFSFILLFVIASFAACFALYMREEAPSEEEPVQTVIMTEETRETVPVDTFSSTADINPVPEGFKLDSSYLDECMFAGDSLMVGLGSYGFIPEDRIAAAIGMSVMDINSRPLANPDGSEILAADKINAVRPKALYILLGLNMMGTYTDEQLLASYGDFIDSIDRSETSIYVISVPPVTGGRETDADRPILNADIDRFNEDLMKFANDRRVYYIDLNTALKGADGLFPEEYAEKDGIHFKKSTYNILLDYLLTHVYMGRA